MRLMRFQRAQKEHMSVHPRTEQDGRATEVLDHLPYGVVVLHARRVVNANRAAVKLLWDLDGGGPPVHCSEIFACRAPGGPCEQGCLVERAATSAEALPEIRIDSATGGAVTALWVTAAPLEREGEVVLHLRPGDARDRRRRSDPHWLDGPQLRIYAFGRTWVDSREGPIGGQWLQQRPGLLLKYLVAERNRVVHADEIAEALWPGTGRQSVNNVRHFMHALRSKLEPDRKKGEPSSFIVTVQGGYALDRRRVHIDADLFEEAARDGLAAGAAGRAEDAFKRLERAIALYRGDLLADEPYAEWAYDERDRLRTLAAQALREIVRLRLERRSLPEAAEALERLTELEPYDVDVHRTLLAVFMAEGRRTEASRRYQAFKARLAREFGEEPGFSLAEARLDAPAG
jgi:DNA-binding SARP family transcriptional activator